MNQRRFAAVRPVIAHDTTKDAVLGVRLTRSTVSCHARQLDDEIGLGAQARRRPAPQRGSDRSPALGAVGSAVAGQSRLVDRRIDWRALQDSNLRPTD